MADPGIRLTALPDLGEFTDASFVAGHRTGVGKFAATAIGTYVNGKLPRSVVNVTAAAYGAVGNGTTDDTTAVQAAITAAIAAGSVVYFPPGTYRLTAPLTGTDLRGMRGDGENVSILKWDVAASSGISLSYSDDSHFFDMADLTLRQTVRGGTALKLDYSTLDLTYPGQRDRYIVQRVRFDGAGAEHVNGWDYGVDTIAGAYGKVVDCNFIGFQFRSGSGSRDPSLGFIRFRGISTAYHNGHPVVVLAARNGIFQCVTGIYFEGCEGAYAIENTMVEVTSGIQFNGGDLTRPHLVARDNHINGYSFGIRVLELVDGAIEGNVIYRISTATGDTIGVDVTGLQADNGFTRVIGNSFLDAAGGTSKLTCIRVGQASGGATIPNILLDDNMFRYALTGVLLEASSQGVKVGPGNSFGSLTTTVTDLGSGNALATAAVSTQGFKRSTDRVEQKWGTLVVALNASGNGTITFPFPFAGAILNASLTHADPASAVGVPVVNMPSSNVNTLAVSIRPNPGAVNVQLSYQAIGY